MMKPIAVKNCWWCHASCHGGLGLLEDVRALPSSVFVRACAAEVACTRHGETIQAG
jgi:hypothetical protein